MPRIAVTVAEQRVIQAIRRENTVVLTPREEQMVRLIRSGACTHKDLANAMFLTPGSSKIYMQRIFLKLRDAGYQVGSMAGLIAWAWARERGELETYCKSTPEILYPPTVIHELRRSA